MLLIFAYARPWRRKQRHGRESGVAQTAHPAAGVFAAPQLEALSCRLTPGVGRAVSLPPGDSTLVLRQCRQKPVLLPRLRPGWRPDPLRPTLPEPTIPPNRGSSPRGTHTRSRFPATGRDGRLLSTPAPPSSRSPALFGAARPARSYPDRGTRYRLCSRREVTAASGYLVRFVRSVARDRLDQSPWPRCLLPASHLPLPPARPHRQPLRPQYRRRVSSPSAAALQGRIVRLGVRHQFLHRDSGGGTVRFGRALASRFS